MKREQEELIVESVRREILRQEGGYIGQRLPSPDEINRLLVKIVVDAYEETQGRVPIWIIAISVPAAIIIAMFILCIVCPVETIVP